MQATQTKNISRTPATQEGRTRYREFVAAAVMGLLASQLTGCGDAAPKAQASAKPAEKGEAAGGNATDKNVCKGHNACKGKGGCKSGDNGCAAKNSCKGHGGCATAEKHACKGKNECKAGGGCKAGDNGCAGKNSCKGHGGCAVPTKDAAKGS